MFVLRRSRSDRQWHDGSRRRRYGARAVSSCGPIRGRPPASAWGGLPDAGVSGGGRRRRPGGRGCGSAGPATPMRSRIWGGWLTTVVARVSLDMAPAASRRGCRRRRRGRPQRRRRDGAATRRTRHCWSTRSACAPLRGPHTLPGRAARIRAARPSALRRDRSHHRPLLDRGEAARQPGSPRSVRGGRPGARRRPRPPASGRRRAPGGLRAGDFDVPRRRRSRRRARCRRRGRPMGIAGRGPGRRGRRRNVLRSACWRSRRSSTGSWRRGLQRPAWRMDQ